MDGSISSGSRVEVLVYDAIPGFGGKNSGQYLTVVFSLANSVSDIDLVVVNGRSLGPSFKDEVQDADYPEFCGCSRDVLDISSNEVGQLTKTRRLLHSHHLQPPPPLSSADRSLPRDRGVGIETERHDRRRVGR